jgi:serine/threonine protein kinase
LSHFLFCFSHGYFRDAWLIPNPIDPGETDTISSDFVLKQTRLPTDDDDEYHLPSHKSFRKTEREAIIMERLTASPRIVNIYGFCGLSILSETALDEVADLIVPPPGQINQSVLDQQPLVQSMNNYTAVEKLKIALDMSKSIADLHGFIDGVVVHGDIHPEQWLRSQVNGKLKLNDFNNAELLSLKSSPGSANDTVFCKAERGCWSGFYRSPEEFLCEPMDEKIDVYSMGNNIYSLITGLVSWSTKQCFGAIVMYTSFLKLFIFSGSVRNKNLTTSGRFIVSLIPMKFKKRFYNLSDLTLIQDISLAMKISILSFSGR